MWHLPLQRHALSSESKSWSLELLKSTVLHGMYTRGSRYLSTSLVGTQTSGKGVSWNADLQNRKHEEAQYQSMEGVFLTQSTEIDLVTSVS